MFKRAKASNTNENTTCGVERNPKKGIVNTVQVMKKHRQPMLKPRIPDTLGAAFGSKS